MVDSHLPPGEGKPKSEAWVFSPAVVEAAFKLELGSEFAASDRLGNGGAFGLLEPFLKSASIEPRD